MNQARIFRIVGPYHTVQYGWWEEVAAQRRFKIIREWKDEQHTRTRQQAEDLVERFKLQVLLEPDQMVPAESAPLPQRNWLNRAISQIPATDLVERALAGLPEPLPEIEESHLLLGCAVPIKRPSGRQFYVWINETAYKRLAAMAVAAHSTRAKILEALILYTEAK